MSNEFEPFHATYDDKGRQNVESMSVRQLLEESVKWQRVTGDTLEQMMSSMGSNPMFKALIGRFGG